MIPLVFLPGAAGRASFWEPVATRLRDLGATHEFAWPGFAGSPPDEALRSLGDLYAWMLARLPEGPSHVIAQSMGGVLAARLAIEQPERVGRLVLVATSGGLDVSALGGADWRADYLASFPGVPRWFVDDRTELTARLGEIRAPTLLLWGEADPISPVAVGRRLKHLLPHTRLRVIESASHGFAEERPDEVAEAIRCHLLG